MGKGYNNYMCKKPFHPGSKANIKRAWMAEQKTENEKRKQEDLKVQYEKEQELYNNRALLSTESKDKLELNFMYEAPPGAKRERQKEDDEPEFKFEWQRKYNAPREDYAKGNADIKDQPFGIPVRNVRCIKCHKWGHINTDKECPLFSQASTSSMPTTSMDPMELMRQMREDGFGLKESVLGHQLNPQAANQQLLPSDESDPEMEFLKSLSASEKKKLLRKLKKLSKKQEKASSCKKKKSKKSRKSKSKNKSSDHSKNKKSRKNKTSESSDDSSSESSSEDSSYEKRKKKHSKDQISKKSKKRDLSESSNSDSDSDEPKHLKTKESSQKKNEKAVKKHSRKSDSQRILDVSSENESAPEKDPRSFMCSSAKNRQTGSYGSRGRNSSPESEGESKSNKRHTSKLTKTKASRVSSKDLKRTKSQQQISKKSDFYVERSSSESNYEKNNRHLSGKTKSSQKGSETKDKCITDDCAKNTECSKHSKYEPSKSRDSNKDDPSSSKWDRKGENLEEHGNRSKEQKSKKKANEKKHVESDNEKEQKSKRKRDEQKTSESKRRKYDEDLSENQKSKFKHFDDKCSESQQMKDDNDRSDEQKSERKEEKHEKADSKEKEDIENISKPSISIIKCDSPTHPDGFSHVCPQARIETNYLQAELEYQGNEHDDFRHFHRERRSPSVKQKYNK